MRALLRPERHAGCAAQPSVVVDGTTLPASAIVSIKDKTYVSLRADANALNADVAFDGRTKTVTLTTVVRQAVMRVGDTTVLVNGERATMNAAPQLVLGRVMLPLRARALAMGAHVAFDSANHRVVIAFAQGSATPSGAATSASRRMSRSATPALFRTSTAAAAE